MADTPTLPTKEKWLKAYDNNRRQVYAMDENKNIYNLRVNAFDNDTYCYVKWQWISTTDLSGVIWNWRGVIYNGADYVETGWEIMVQSWNDVINMAYMFTYTLSFASNDADMWTVDESEAEVQWLSPILVEDNVLTIGEWDDAIVVTATAETWYHFVSRWELPAVVNSNLEITATFAEDE